MTYFYHFVKHFEQVVPYGLSITPLHLPTTASTTIRRREQRDAAELLNFTPMKHQKAESHH